MLENIPGFRSQYLCANFSIILSIFCASPGSLKLQRNSRSADTMIMSLNSCMLTNAVSTSRLKSSLSKIKQPSASGQRHRQPPTLATYFSPKYSPIAVLFSPSLYRNLATSSGVLSTSSSATRYSIPYSTVSIEK